VFKTTATAALELDKEAILLDQNNYLQFLNKELLNHTFYTSLGDLPKDMTIVYSILDKADDLIYCPVTSWSGGKDLDVTDVTSSMQGLTEFILFNISHIKHNVYNLDLTKYNASEFIKLADNRKNHDPQLWVAGGSIAFGMGVDIDDRCGNILGNKLSLSVSTLAAPGASIPWITDQIIRSDIRSGDFVVVTMVPDGRLSVWSTTKNRVVHLSAHTDFLYDSIDISKSAIDQFLVSDTRLYENIVHIHQLVNFCKKAGAKLFIIGIGGSDTLSIRLNNIIEFKNYYNAGRHGNDAKGFADIGNDNRHPGPAQHKLYADFCYQQFKKLNYI